MDSTSTCHCSNLKISFEELSYKFCLIRKSVYSTTAFLLISVGNQLTKRIKSVRSDHGGEFYGKNDGSG